MIRCVVFDFDGTLVDSNDIKLGSFYAVTREFDPDGALVDAALARPDKGDRHEITRHLARQFAERGAFPAAEADERGRQFVAAYARLCEEQIRVCDEVPGATAALRELAARGLPLFINSGTTEDALQTVVGQRGLDGFFAGVHGAPSSKIENLCRERDAAGVDSGEMLVVGDGDEDRVAAEEFGCSFIGVALRDAKLFERTPDHLISDLTRLTVVLDEIDAADATAESARVG